MKRTATKPKAPQSLQEGKSAPTSGRVGVLVIGMHRSGTSAMARVLSLLGCDLPTTLIGASRSNEPGHWQSPAILRLNERILASAGSSWDDWLEFNAGWFLSPEAEEFRAEAINVLREEFGSSPLFVLKDPRLCRIAPFWVDVLGKANVRPAVILPLRNPLEVAASLEKRDGLDPSFSHLLWLRHVLDAEFDTRGIPRFFTSFARLISDWPRVVGDAQEKLGIRWPRMPAEVAEEVDTFLSEEFRHHSHDPATVTTNPLISNSMRRAFELLNGWSESGERPEEYEELDQIRIEFNRAAPTFAPVIAAAKVAVEKSRQAERVAIEARAAQKQSEAAAAEAVQRAAQSGMETEAARRELKESKERISKLTAELDSRMLIIEDTRKSLAETKARLDQTESALAQRRQEAEQTAKQLASTRTDLHNEKRALKKRVSEIVELTQLLRKEQDAARSNEHQARLRAKESAKLLRQVNRQSERIKEQLLSTRRQLEAVQTSLSWRITAPLRRVSYGLRWLLHRVRPELNGIGEREHKLQSGTALPADSKVENVPGSTGP